MKTIRRVEVTPEFVKHVPDMMEEGKIYISREFGTAIHLCLCGCGEQVVTPLRDNGWTLTEENGKISLAPSIGNFKFACRSHYIITRNRANFV